MLICITVLADIRQTMCDLYQHMTCSLLSFIISLQSNLNSFSRAINVMGKVTLDFSQIYMSSTYKAISLCRHKICF